MSASDGHRAMSQLKSIKVVMPSLEGAGVELAAIGSREELQAARRQRCVVQDDELGRIDANLIHLDDPQGGGVLDRVRRAVFPVWSRRHGTASRTSVHGVAPCLAGARSVSLRRWKPNGPDVATEEAMSRHRRNALILAGVVMLLILALIGWVINGTRSPSWS